MINLKDLLVHEVLDLYSAEEQIIAALPKMIEKAGNNQLKKALQDHLKVTEEQKNRLDEVKKLLLGAEEAENQGKSKGLFGLFGGGSHKCKGTQGLIEEGEKIMGEDMTPEVLDAAIIASAQKIEHYEICGYGTARAYARELNLGDVAELLEETLNEEYEADDLLTDLAVGRLNEKAQHAEDDEEGEGRSSGKRSSNKNSADKKKASSGKSNAAKPAPARSNGSGRATRSASKSSSKSAAKGSATGRKASKSVDKSSSSRGKSASGRSRSSRASSR